MKPTEFKNEDAIDILADIIEPFTEIASDKKLSELYKSGATRAKMVAVAIKDHKKACIQILAALNHVPVEEYSGNIVQITKCLLELLSDKELLGFFFSQSQMTE